MYVFTSPLFRMAVSNLGAVISEYQPAVSITTLPCLIVSGSQVVDIQSEYITLAVPVAPAGPAGPEGPAGPAGPAAPAGPAGPSLPQETIIVIKAIPSMYGNNFKVFLIIFKVLSDEYKRLFFEVKNFSSLSSVYRTIKFYCTSSRLIQAFASVELTMS